MIEIEHKFLLDNLDGLDLTQLDRVAIRQGYLSVDPVVRVRISRQGNFIGVKGPGTISRLELEYKIPIDDAEKLIALSPGKIEKTRYFYPSGKHVWEIDVFEGKLKGLLLAEVELSEEGEKFEIPDFMKSAWDVSHERDYTNARLSIAQRIPSRGCNRHDECRKPGWLLDPKNAKASRCCSEEDCEDCFGK